MTRYRRARATLPPAEQVTRNGTITTDDLLGNGMVYIRHRDTWFRAYQWDERSGDYRRVGIEQSPPRATLRAAVDATRTALFDSLSEFVRSLHPLMGYTHLYDSISPGKDTVCGFASTRFSRNPREVTCPLCIANTAEDLREIVSNFGGDKAALRDAIEQVRAERTMAALDRITRKPEADA